METTNENIPALRFPEFNGGWELKQLGELSSRIGDGIHSTPQYDDEGDFYFINGNNLVNGKIVTNENTRRVNSIEFEKHKRTLNRNTILLSINGTIGNLAYYNDEPVVLGKSACYINLKDVFNKTFVFNVLQSYSIQRFYNSELTGTTIKNLSLATVKNTEFHIPDIKEQQKIASFLTAIDDKILQLQKKKQLLEQYKKGVMQQIFTLKLRFKDNDGNDYPEWENKVLGEIADVSKLAGYEFTKHIVYNDTGKIIALRGLNIKNNKLELTEVKYIDDSNLKMLSRSKLFVNDLMFTYVGTIGEVALILENDRFYLGPNVARIRITNSQCLPIFINQYFNNAIFKNNEIKKYIATSSQPALSMTNIRKFVLNIPALEEQQKIADFLFRIDDKYNLVSKQIEQTQNFKKGLLQQMFV